MNAEFFAAIAQLEAEKGIPQDYMLDRVAQALLAAKAGASYVSPFVGRLDDISSSGVELVSDIAEIFSVHSISTEIIAASIRGPQDVIEAAKAGSHIATVPYKVINQMLRHPLTDSGLEKFIKDAETAKAKE